ncbi:hypothetical protein QLQ12_37785 [Actinoplanes sp. NEAU-A12]|uniref:Uncharacterized protein n=1 Tax=Actinoplanes sandaracinus TaxID=3045177 RepID=A0ABT6WX89_9ACTN|nr:hypothetical protein [Actinoplanes sandaracinus]MDI6104358.1 hypothetical protein [Actinoplanes sandaracinus]
MADRDVDGFVVLTDLYGEEDWLCYLLRFSAVPHGCWVLEEPARHKRYLRVVDLDETLTDPGALEQAQRWAAWTITHGPVNATWAEAVDCVNPPGLPRFVQWLAVRCDGWTGYAALMNVTRPCEVPVTALDPETGADCICLYKPQECGRCSECAMASARAVSDDG